MHGLGTTQVSAELATRFAEAVSYGMSNQLK
jgi:hypothetical protein